MSKKYILLLIFSFFFSVMGYGQNIQLLFQSFTFNMSTDTLATGIGSNSGFNRWRMDTSYYGQGIYPNTVSQDSTYGGQINGAPYSRYLHIYNSDTNAAQMIYNCSYDPSIASDRFAIVDDDGVCTIGFDTVYFSFFYTCMGDTNNAYGQVYYSRNSGPWTLASQQRYSNKSKWKYELITDPAFANATNLRFGFRWINNSSAASVTTAMGVDDAQIVGHFDTVTAAAATITTFVSDDTVCVGTNLDSVFAVLSDTVCDGTYVVEMSDGNGNFTNPTAFWSVNIFYPNDTSVYVSCLIPNSVFPGNCYRFRFRRYLPLDSTAAPVISIPSPCVVIISCVNSVTTLQPIVAMDSISVCTGSVIDVPFYSYGVFALNQYVAQLSDSSGSFANPITLGSMWSDITYDPNNPLPGYPPPGNVAGLIPDSVIPGCNYYVRVIATGPTVGPSPVLGTPWGPFCIQHCDIITNNKQDVCVCLYPDSTICVQINVNINYYDSSAVYMPLNEFKIQIISRGPSPPPFWEVGTLGALGNVTAINDTTVQVCFSPGILTAAGVPPGNYYMRIVATNPSGGPDSAFGSIVRLSVFSPSFIPPIFFAYNYPSYTPFTGGKLCQGEYIIFFAFPPPGAGVRWVTSFGNFTQNPFLVWFNGAVPVTIRVQETYGSVSGPCYCVGPLSTPMNIQVKGPPNVNIIGNATICLGDTIKYKTALQTETFFLWSVSDTLHGFITNLANNEAWFTFDSAGTYQISVYGLNDCFDATGTKTITVKDTPIANIGMDSTAICAGSQITLISAPADTGWTYQWTLNNVVLGTNDTLVASPATPGTYFVKVTTKPPACNRRDSIFVDIEQPPESFFSDTVCADGSSIVLDPGVVAESYIWNNGDTTQQLTVNDTGTYSVNIQVTGEICYRIYTYTIGSEAPDSSEQNSFICSGDTLLLLDATQAGATGYTWNTGDSTAQLIVDTAGTYWVHITTPGERCSFTRVFYVMDDPQLCPDSVVDFVLDFKLPNVFTPNGDKYNEFFHALTYGNYNQFLIKIFNRWGELVFESTDQYFQWDGKNPDGKECTAGVYYYVGNLVHPEDTRTLHGFVTLLR